ncbi:MAG: carboxypeptidase-like regulatory domain-containing protein [Planctomycetota bacterium]
MSLKKTVPVVCILLTALTAGVNQTIAAENGRVHLRFSLKTAVVTVSGRVTDKENGEPIANATVRGHVVIWRYRGPDLFEKCPYQETTTAADGKYQLQFVTALTTSGTMKGDDSLCVYVSAPGYETMPKYCRPSVTPESTDYRDFNFELGPGKPVKGTVVDEGGGPVEGALVRVQTGQNGDWNFFGALGKRLRRKTGVLRWGWHPTTLPPEGVFRPSAGCVSRNRDAAQAYSGTFSAPMRWAHWSCLRAAVSLEPLLAPMARRWQTVKSPLGVIHAV